MDSTSKDEFISSIENIDNILKIATIIDVLLRNGNIVSAYRQGVQSVNLFDKDNYRKIMSRALVRMRKGEQIDALNDIKAIQDLMKNEKRQILLSVFQSTPT